MSPASSILAAFITPSLFFGGAAAITAPILIHLLARRRFKRIRWAAMEFLLDAQRRNRRRIRLEEWILLALRCLAVLFIAMMIARPFLQAAGVVASLGGSRRTERVFVLDDSLSMGYQSADGSPFARGKVAIQRLIQSIRNETPDDTVTLLRMSAPTSPIESGTFLDDQQTEDLLARLDAINPTQRAIDPTQVLDGVVEILKQSPDITSAAVYLISDFQRHNWTGVARRTPQDLADAADPTELDAGVLAPLKAWADEDRGLHLVLVNIGEKNASNIALTELNLVGGRLVAGATGTARARVANFSDRAVDHVELQLGVGNLDQPSTSLRELGAWQQSTVDVDIEFFRAGFENVKMELPPDALPGDNIRHAAVDVATAVRVLIVNGEASDDDYDDEVTFLETALRPEGEVFSGNEAVVVDETQLEEVNLNSFHAVILANVYRLSEPAIDALERFVRQGGGLLVFLGDQVDADLYNGALYREGAGLLPAELTEIVRAAEASHLVITDQLHPAMRGLGREGDPLGIGQIPFFEYFACAPFEVADADGNEEAPTTGKPTVSTTGTAVSEVATAARTARVVARFSDAMESPAIVERRFGLGRVTMITTAADKEWNLWPDHPTFLPVMMELVRHAATQDATQRDQWVGEKIELPIDPAVYEADAVVRTPAYPNEDEVGITAVPADDGRGLVLGWEHTETAGLYRFLLRRREGGESVRMMAVNIDPAESDLTTADEAELRRSMGGVPFQYVNGLDQLRGGNGEARTELWRLMLIAAAATLMIEQFLAWSWGRRS